MTAAEHRADRLDPPAPARVAGARPGGVYGAALGALVLSVVIASLVFSYGYLAVNAESWPPDDVATPGLTRPVLGTVLVVAAAAVVNLARGGLLDEAARARLVTGTAISTLVGAPGLVVLWIETADQPFAADAHSYAAAVFVLWGTILTLVAACLYANVFALMCGVRRKVGLEHEGLGHVLRTAWTFSAAATVLLVLVVTLGAHAL